MLKQNLLKVALSGALITSIVAAPFTVNIERLSSYAQADKEVYTEPIDTLTFISSSSETEKIIEHIKTTKKDETLDNLRDKLKKNALKVNSIKLSGKLDKANKNLSAESTTIATLDATTQESTDIAANVEDVRTDAILRSTLRVALQQGKRVYLYGTLTISEYKELLNLDEIKLASESGEGYLIFGEEPEEVDTEKGALQPGATLEEESSSFIGYTLDQTEITQLVDGGIMSVDEVGQPRENDEEAYIEAIMEQQSTQLVLPGHDVEGPYSLISTNKALAENKEVAQKYGTYMLVKDGRGRKIGRVDMDWRLFKETKDNSVKYDSFTLAPTTQANAYNGAIANKIYTNLYLPYTNDELRVWSPVGDSYKEEYDVTLGFPFSFSVSMTFSDHMNVTDQSSLGYDYGRWNVTDPNLDDEIFKGTIGFESVGKQAYATYEAIVTVWTGTSNQYPVKVPRKTVINYKYS